jgi:hypothetical protein
MSKCQKNNRRRKYTVKPPILQVQSIAAIEIKRIIAKKRNPLNMNNRTQFAGVARPVNR